MQASSGNTKLKLLYLTDIFRLETDEDHALSVYELIDKLAGFGITVSRQVLCEDIDLLKNYGMDIHIKKQAGRNPRLYNLVSRDFNLTDLKLLVDAVQSSQLIKTPKDKELIRKLSSLTSKYQAKQLE